MGLMPGMKILQKAIDADPEWSSRVGKFSIPSKLIYEKPGYVLAVMANCIVLECWNSLVDQRMHYTCLSDLFEAGEKDQKLQEYVWVINDDLTEVQCFKVGEEPGSNIVKETIDKVLSA